MGLYGSALEDTACPEVIEPARDVGKAIDNGFTVATPVSSINPVSLDGLPESLKGIILMVEELDKDEGELPGFGGCCEQALVQALVLNRCKWRERKVRAFPAINIGAPKLGLFHREWTRIDSTEIHGIYDFFRGDSHHEFRYCPLLDAQNMNEIRVHWRPFAVRSE